MRKAECGLRNAEIEGEEEGRGRTGFRNAECGFRKAECGRRIAEIEGEEEGRGKTRTRDERGLSICGFANRNSGMGITTSARF